MPASDNTEGATFGDWQVADRLDGLFNTVELHEELDSTNALAATFDAGLPALVVCGHQRAGRGRRDRTWLSAPGHSLTMSVAVELASKSCAGLSIAVAVGVAQALEENGSEVSLKWPNDLLGPNGGKLGGLLVEIRDKPFKAVIGLGVNLLPFKQLAAADFKAECLCAAEAELDRGLLLAQLAEAVLRSAKQWDKEGMAQVHKDWPRYCAHKPGELLHVKQSDGASIAVTYRGLGANGELLACDHEGRDRKFASAEVIHHAAGD